MARLIDADALEKKLHEFALDEWNQRATTSWSNAFLECEDIVYNAQTVDAVEVVRCKDCRYYDAENHNCLDELGYSRVWEEDDYCSFAERREDAE